MTGGTGNGMLNGAPSCLAEKHCGILLPAGRVQAVPALEPTREEYYTVHSEDE
jgi:hypothetical protein